MRTSVELSVNAVMKLWILSKARNFVVCFATIKLSGITPLILLGIRKCKDDKGMYVCMCIGPTGWGRCLCTCRKCDTS